MANSCNSLPFYLELGGEINSRVDVWNACFPCLSWRNEECVVLVTPINKNCLNVNLPNPWIYVWCLVCNWSSRKDDFVHLQKFFWFLLHWWIVIDSVQWSWGLAIHSVPIWKTEIVDLVPYLTSSGRKLANNQLKLKSQMLNMLI